MSKMKDQLSQREIAKVRKVLTDYEEGHLNEGVLFSSLQNYTNFQTKRATRSLETIGIHWCVLFCIGCFISFFMAYGSYKESKVASGVEEQSFQPTAQTVSADLKPLDIATDFLIDDSPPGSWDFTLIDPSSDSTKVDIPSPCDGIIDDVWFQGHNGGLESGSGAGQIVEVNCGDFTYLFGHLDSTHVKAGQQVALGESIGIQGSTGRSSGDHVHLQLHDPESGDRITDRTITGQKVDKYFALAKGG
ncbi:MAG: M23 family metallopeptidase [Elainellaceae cyanobacterium]